MEKYENLTKRLKESRENQVRLSFDELEQLLGKLSPASKYRSWWNNSNATSQGKAWQLAGYKVDKVVPDYYVLFTKLITNQKSLSTTPKKENSGKTMGYVLLAIISFILLPIFIYFLSSFDFEAALAVAIVMVILSLSAGFLLYDGSPKSDTFYSSSTNDNLYQEIRNHNIRVEHMMRENESHRLQEENYRIMNQNEKSLADKFDTRITNIFKNPWDGIL